VTASELTTDRLVEEFQIRIAIHNHGPGSYYSVPEDVIEATAGHHKYIGACVDIGHYERSGVRAEDALRSLRDLVYDMHLKDVDARVKSGRTVVIGEGVIDFDAVFDELVNMRFERHVALEYEAEKDNPLPSMAKSLRNLRSILA